MNPKTREGTWISENGLVILFHYRSFPRVFEFLCNIRLAKAAGLTLRLHEVQNVSLTNGALNVTNNSTVEKIELLARCFRPRAFKQRTQEAGNKIQSLMAIFRFSYRVVSSRNSTLTWVTPPREPVRPKILTTRPFLALSSCSSQ